MFVVDTESDNKADDERAMLHPYDPLSQPPPGFLTGSLAAIPKGVEQGLYQTEMLATSVRQMTPFKTDEEDAEEYMRSLMNKVHELKVDPERTGYLGQIVGGTLPILTEAAFGSLVGGPLGAVGAVTGTETIAGTARHVEEGVDIETAKKLGYVEGAAGGIGAAMPMALGGKVLTRLASGAGLQVGFGGATRGLEGEILRRNGYEEMAKQYKILDTAAIFTDAVLGAGFVAIHEGGRYVKGLGKIEEKAQLPPVGEKEVAQVAEVKPADGGGPVPVERPSSVTISEKQPTQAEVTFADRVHNKAKELSPRRMGEYEQLVAERELLSGVMEKLRSARKTELEETNIHAKEISELEESVRNNIEKGNERQAKKLQAKIDDLKSKQEKWREDNANTQSPELKKALEQYQEVDYKLRDVAEKVSSIYREAERRIVKEGFRPSDIDTALAANDMRNAQVDSAPGVATNIETMNAHSRAINKATEQVLRDQPVDVAKEFGDPSFLPKEKPSVDVSALLKDEGFVEKTPEILQQEGVRILSESPSDKPSSPFPSEKQIAADQDVALRQVEQSVLVEKPDMIVGMTEEGKPITAGEMLAEADANLIEAQRDASLFEVAITCFLRNAS